MLIYHHCRSLESVVFGEVKANPKYFDSYLKEAYFWLTEEVGFYPLFLAVGESEEDIRMTGYQSQWRRVIGTKNVGRRKDGTYIQKNVLIKKGELSNNVLFSFEDIEGVFMDYGHWHLAFSLGSKNYKIRNYENRWIFKPSWNKADWLRKVRKEPCSVQLITSKLYLPDAKRIWVRNKETQNILEKMGFENISVKKIYLYSEE